MTVTLNKEFESTPPLTLNTISKKQKDFRFEFCEQILLTIQNDKKTQEIQKKYLYDVITFTEDLGEKGMGEITGEDTNCRPVAVTVQGAIEELLAVNLGAHKIKNVKVLILTPAPCTPIMKEGPTEGLAKDFEKSRQHTLDQREFSLRQLRDAGALIQVAYSKEKYDAMLKTPSPQTAVYEKEKIKQNTIDQPLKASVPDELVGALYEFDGWILVTQGVQARDAKEGIKTWKIWMMPTNVKSDALERAEAMKAFVEKNK